LLLTLLYFCTLKMPAYLVINSPVGHVAVRSSGLDDSIKSTQSL
jgi:hypothetical protein